MLKSRTLTGLKSIFFCNKHLFLGYARKESLFLQPKTAL